MSGRRGHGEGSIFRHEGSGKWTAVLDLGWVDGKRRRRWVYGETRQEVVRKLAALQRSREQGTNLAARPRSVAEWLDEWLRDIKAHDGTRGSTLNRYRGVVETHLKPGLGKHRLDRLTPADVQAFIAGLTSRRAPATVVKVHGVLRVALADAERMDLVPRNVAKSVRPPSIPQPDRRFLSVAESRHLLEVAAPDRLEGVFVAALGLGLRRGEVLGLKWDDIDFEKRLLRVARAVQRVDGQVRVVEPKTRRSRRVLPMPAMVVAALERQRARQAAERLKAGRAWQDLGFVFASVIGTPLEPRNVNHRFGQLRDQAGLPWLRLHDLRHACATYLLASGVEPRTVMEILGHSTIRLTMDLYGHVLPERMAAAAEAMDRALGD